MGNLEKAGVLVVVVLLAIILGVAFHNNGEPNDKALSALQQQQQGSGAARIGEAETPQEPQDPGTNSGVKHVPGTKAGDPPERIEPTDKQSDGRDSSEKPPVDPKPKPVQPTPEVEVKPVTPRPFAPPVVSEWPKTVKVEKTDGSLLAVVRRVYGAKDAQAMLPVVLKENPGLKPKALKVGQELIMPAKAAKADATNDVADRKSNEAKSTDKKSAATPNEKKASGAGAKSAVAKDVKSGTKKATTKPAAEKTTTAKSSSGKAAAVKASVTSGEKKRLSFMPKR